MLSPQPHSSSFQPALRKERGWIVLPNGDVLVADRLHHQIKRVTPAGAVTVLAGSGSPGYVDGPASQAKFQHPQGVAFDPTSGNVYVADTANNVIRKIAAGVVSTVANEAMKQPVGLAVEGNGDLIVADTGNHRIKRVTADGIVTVVAGSGGTGLVDGLASQATFSLPEGVAVTPAA